jgi:hypothetical protein
METITKTAAELRRELLAERVERGVALLDREMPDWWRADRGADPESEDEEIREPIDLDMLDMGEGGWCVFGQLEEPGSECAYFSMSSRVFDYAVPGSERTEAEIEHGVYAIRESNYPILTDLWREVIEKRRADA